MISSELLAMITIAREVFRSHGRGLVVVLDDREEAHYSSLEEFRESLADEPEATALVATAAQALETYDPEREAVVVKAQNEGAYVVIVRAEGAKTLGGLIYTRTQ